MTSIIRLVSVICFSCLLLACSVESGGGGTTGTSSNGFLPGNEPVDPGKPAEPGKPVNPLPPVAGNCVDPIDIHSTILSNGFGFNPSNTRNQSSAINSSNVADLARKFEYVKPGLIQLRGAAAVTEQAIFFTAGNELIAIDRDSGCRYWVYQAAGAGEGFTAAAILLAAIPGQDPVIFAGDFNGFVYAIDMQSGDLLWKQFAGITGDSKSEFNHFITGGMQYDNGQLFVPVSSKEIVSNLLDLDNPCCVTHGLLVAFDALTGDRNWTFHTTHAATIASDIYRIGPNGAAIDSTPVIDPARNAIYISTGANYTEPVSNLSDAIVSIDMTNGGLIWVFQARDDDQWNASCHFPDQQIDVNGEMHNIYDRCPDPEGSAFGFRAAPILTDDGNALIAGDKGGTVYSLDPDRGDLNWIQKVSTGGMLGGIHWGMAVDEWAVYVAATDLTIAKASAFDDSVENRIEPVADARPGIYALDLRTGGLVWETHPTHEGLGGSVPSLYSASLSLSNDVLFAGSLDGVVKAFSTLTGAELWSLDTAIAVTDVNGVEGNGGAIDSVGVVIAGDTLLVNSGAGSFDLAGQSQAGQGGVLFLLSLPEI